MADTTAHNIGDRSVTRQRIAARLAARHRSEFIFRNLGLLAIILAIGCVAALFGNIMIKGVPSFMQPQAQLDVYFDPSVIKSGNPPVEADYDEPAKFEADYISWQRKMALLNWGKLVSNAVEAAAPDTITLTSRDASALIARSERLKLRDMFVQDPSIVGETVPVSFIVSADADNWLKGTIDRSLPDERQQLSAATRELADYFKENGTISFHFAWSIFNHVDSRSAPASAGLAGAFMGSLYMLVVVIVLSVPIGVASAIYLEEFAPKSRLTDIIEVNINNLAAVPSIVFGLLGAAVFINYFRLPYSAPVVGGLVLTLMTLPTIIIASRAALKGVSPSLRQAALGLGASKTQMVFHHVLPVIYPSILTATIIGVAQALGETAPLLLIGMNAFIASVPATPMDPATALPAQIYIWQGNENRNFFEARTSAAIMVLLGLMILLNAIAILLRTRLEKRA